MAFSNVNRRWLLVFVGAVLIALALGSFLIRSSSPSILVTPISASLPADGREHAALRVSRSDGGPLKASETTVEAIGGSSKSDYRDFRIVQTGKHLEVWVQAPVANENWQILVHHGQKAQATEVRFALDTRDSFGDGTPDALRLHSTEDRTAFRQWFWRLAEMQADLPDNERAAEIQDCAALLRYSYREALTAHDAEWANAQHVGDIAFQSVRQWRYPRTMLGTGLFRVKAGPFVEADVSNGAFAQFADAHALMSWNTYRLGRSLSAAKPGDVIFFRQLEENSPYHSMVITGSNAGWVVYHTGPIGKRKGEMRRMTLSDLLRHPDARWRPVAENSNFLGVFRWNVLREGD